ncbi:MAG: transposase, partial [Nanoarchaeota archaeon]
GINKQPTFTSTREYKRALSTILLYRFNSPPVKLSKFLLMKTEVQSNIIKALENNKLVEIHSYTFMPNHFHFLLTQVFESGISKFMGNFQNSYTRYFNTKNKRDGSLFLDQFKAKRIEDDKILIHVQRYIDLNPYTSFILKDIDELAKYPWSSLKDYLNDSDSDICDKKLIMSIFKSKDIYLKFVLNQADYQRTIDKIKHLTFE